MVPGPCCAPVTAIEVATDSVCAGLPLSLTIAVKLDVPVVTGAPEIVPVVAASVNPEGRLPEEIDQV